MSERGRCAGCRETGERKAVERHVLFCAEFGALYRADRDRALPAAQEYARWRREEARAEHADDLADRVADTQVRRARSVSRFEVPDPLE